MKKKRLNKINILGTIYKIKYFSKPSDVDHNGRNACFGQVDFWTRTIRLYDKQTKEELFQTLMHEVIHAITYHLHIDDITKSPREETIVDLLATGLKDVFTRNAL